jgi:dihydrofolate reductase
MRYAIKMLSLIVAMAENRVIGRDASLPWHLPADLKFFKRITLGKPVIMGRRTHESIGRPLPGRHNIVITTRSDYEWPGCTVVHSVEEALRAASPAEEIVVIGGATLYRQTLARCDRIYMTLVHARIEGSTRFPALDWRAWKELCREYHPADSQHPYPFSFIRLER